MSAFGTVKLSGILVHNQQLVTSSATVGADHTFSPCGYVTPGVARYEDRTGGIPVGFPVLTLSVKRPSKTSPMYRVTAKIVVPELEETSASTQSGIKPPPTKAFEDTVTVEFLFHSRGTEEKRLRMLSLLKSLAYHGNIAASDDSPLDATGSPLYEAVKDVVTPF